MPSKLSLVKPVCKRDGCDLRGSTHEKCIAHSRANKPCRQSPMVGQFVCKMHGGKTPEALERGKQREALTMALRLTAYDPNDQESLEEGLLREVKQSSQTAQAYGVAVAALQDSIGADGVLQLESNGVRLHALVDAWTAERKLHATLAKMAIDAGIAQRQVDLAESQATMLVQVLVAVLSAPALGLSAEQIIEGKVVAAQEMRTLAAQRPS